MRIHSKRNAAVVDQRNAKVLFKTVGIGAMLFNNSFEFIEFTLESEAAWASCRWGRAGENCVWILTERWTGASGGDRFC